MQESVLIVGAGSGLSESIARLCRSKRMKVVLERGDHNGERLEGLAMECRKECSQS